TVQVKVRVLEPDDYLRPEMNASVAFVAPDKGPVTQRAKPLVVVPSSAIRDGAVFVILDGKAVRKQVVVSGTNAQGTQVESGLIGGEDLVLNPPADLKD